MKGDWCGDVACREDPRSVCSHVLFSKQNSAYTSSICLFVCFLSSFWFFWFVYFSLPDRNCACRQFSRQFLLISYTLAPSDPPCVYFHSSAVQTLADSQSLLSLCPPPVYLFLTLSSVRRSFYFYGGHFPKSELSWGITSEFMNNHASGQFDGFNKQRFILPTTSLNKPALYCFSFELPLLFCTSHPEAERDRETNLTEHDLAVISCT